MNSYSNIVLIKRRRFVGRLVSMQKPYRGSTILLEDVNEVTVAVPGHDAAHYVQGGAPLEHLLVDADGARGKLSRAQQVISVPDDCVFII